MSSFSTRASGLILFITGLVLGAASVTVGASLRGSDQFPDVPTGAYYDEAVGEMASIGVIRGRPDGRFDPAAFATRADIAVMLQRLRQDLLNGGVAVSSTSSSRSSRSSSSSNSSSSFSSSSSSSSAPSNPSGYVRFTTPNFSIKEGAGAAKVTLIRTSGSEGVVSVQYTVAAGTAKAGDDFLTQEGRLTFANGETSRMILVDIVDDTASESNETLTVTLSDPASGLLLGSPVVATVTLQDNDGGSSGTTGGSTAASIIGFGARAYAVAENGGTLTVTVERSGSTTGTSSVSYATNSAAASSGVAQPGTDYGATSGTLSFAAGETAKTFAVTIKDDASMEGNEKFTLTLSNPSGATLASPTTTEVTVMDDENTAIPFGTGSLRLMEESFDVLESAGTFPIIIRRLGGALGDIAVTYRTSDGLAKAGSDYTAVDGTLTFRAGESEKVVSIVILKDDKNDPNETFSFFLSSPTHGATLGTPNTEVITLIE